MENLGGSVKYRESTPSGDATLSERRCVVRNPSPEPVLDRRKPLYLTMHRAESKSPTVLPHAFVATGSIDRAFKLVICRVHDSEREIKRSGEDNDAQTCTCYVSEREYDLRVRRTLGEHHSYLILTMLYYLGMKRSKVATARPVASHSQGTTIFDGSPISQTSDICSPTELEFLLKLV